MDPALVREREKFKQRALALPAVEKRSEAKKESKEKSGKSNKRKSKLSRPKPQPLVPAGKLNSLRYLSQVYVVTTLFEIKAISRLCPVLLVSQASLWCGETSTTCTVL